MTTESDTISAIEAYTYLSVQTSAQATALSNTIASLLYNSASRTQGNFSLFYAMAQEHLANDLVSYGLTLTTAQSVRCYAYLVQHYFEMKQRSWDATSVKQGDDSVSRKGNVTTGMSSYLSLMSSYRAGSEAILSTTLERHSDYDNYPDEWRDSQMDEEEIAFEDPS